MNNATFEILPALPRDLAEAAVRVLTKLLERIPDEPLQCCYVGNWTTNAQHLIELNARNLPNLQFAAEVVRVKAREINADYVMTVLDIEGPQTRTANVSIETRDVTYACQFPVVSKADGGKALALGPGRFERLRKHTSPLAGLLRARKRQRH
jgi:hypothetical protein